MCAVNGQMVGVRRPVSQQSQRERPAEDLMTRNILDGGVHILQRAADLRALDAPRVIPPYNCQGRPRTSHSQYHPPKAATLAISISTSVTTPAYQTSVIGVEDGQYGHRAKELSNAVKQLQEIESVRPSTVLGSFQSGSSTVPNPVASSAASHQSTSRASDTTQQGPSGLRSSPQLRFFVKPAGVPTDEAGRGKQRMTGADIWWGIASYNRRRDGWDERKAGRQVGIRGGGRARHPSLDDPRILARWQTHVTAPEELCRVRLGPLDNKERDGLAARPSHTRGKTPKMTHGKLKSRGAWSNKARAEDTNMLQGIDGMAASTTEATLEDAEGFEHQSDTNGAEVPTSEHAANTPAFA